MSSAEASLVQASHLARRAYLYVRQSTLRQVHDNTESARRQYALRARAEALGWPAEQIEVIDCDQGLSGTSVEAREGFQRLVAEVGMGRAGLVLGLEVSRLARNCSDWHRLVELCAMTGTLVLDQDGLYDPTSFNHQIVLGIKGFMSAVEIGVIRARLRGGLLGKAARGALRVALPVGLVYDEQGQVCLHPDAQVRQSLALLFETFRRTGTAGATVKYFNDKGLLFPRPAGSGSLAAEVLWKPLDLTTVVRILHNPRHAGAYAFGRRRVIQNAEGRSSVRAVPREEWHTLIRDAHPGYIGWDEFERNEEQLRRSALAYGIENRRSPPREGPALLQGLVLCGVCGGRMTVRYHERAEGLVPDYCCSAGRMEYRRPLCQVIAGASIDRAVGEHLVATMTPQAIELTMAVRAELQIRADEADRLRLQQVERAQHEAALAQRRYMQTDPDNRLVATTLEADWNDKLRRLAHARDEAERQRAADRATLDEATEERIRALAEDFPAVWNDATTSDRNRKRMARLLIEDVTLLRSERLHVHIRFKGGAVTSLELPLPENAWKRRLTHPDVTARVGQLLERHDEHETARRLNAEGLRTGAGRPFDADAVRWVRYTHGLETRQQRLQGSGMLTTSEMADRLGRPAATIRGWVRQGRLRGERHGRKAIWLIAPLEQQPETFQHLAARHAESAGDRPRRRDTTPSGLRARIEELVLAGHHDAAIAATLNEEGWRRLKGTRFDAASVSKTRRRCRVPTLWARLRGEGMLTTPELAVALGIGINTVANWARAGRLRGTRYGKAPRARWLFEPLAAQPAPIRRRVAARATVKRHRGLLSDAAAGQGAL